MSSLAHPRGPEPERTYWIRRLIALVALVVALVVIVNVLRTLFGSGQSSAGPVDTPNPSALALNVSASPSATGTASASPSGTASSASASASSADPKQPCTTSNVTVAVSAAAQVVSGKDDSLQVRLTNAGQSPCRIDFSRTPLTIRVYSGADRIWATDHCANWAPSGITNSLTTGRNFTWTVPWPTRRSAAQCTVLPAKLASGTYVARAFLGSNGQPGQQVIHLTA